MSCPCSRTYPRMSSASWPDGSGSGASRAGSHWSAKASGQSPSIWYARVSCGSSKRILRPARRSGPSELSAEGSTSARTATVRATGNVDVFEIDKGTFGELLADALQAPRFAPTMQAVADLQRMSCFSHLETDELVELAEKGDWINVVPGETVVEEGQEGDAFYAISSGQVEVTHDGTSIRTMGPG